MSGRERQRLDLAAEERQRDENARCGEARLAGSWKEAERDSALRDREADEVRSRSARERPARACVESGLARLLDRQRDPRADRGQRRQQRDVHVREDEDPDERRRSSENSIPWPK